MSITVYVKNDCVQCDMTKRTLDNANIDYDTVNLDDNPEALTRVKQHGFLSAPVVITDTDAWAGFQPEKLATIQPNTEQLKNGDIKMQNPEEIQFEENKDTSPFESIWYTAKRAELDNGGELTIAVRQQDNYTYVAITYCDPDGRIFDTENTQDYPKIETVFPRDYWYGGKKQHPAIAEAIIDYSYGYEKFAGEDKQKLIAKMEQKLGENHQEYDIDEIYSEMVITFCEHPDKEESLLVNWDDFEDIAEQYKIDEDYLKNYYYQSPRVKQLRQQQEAASQAVDYLPSFSAAGQAPAQPQAEYAATQYQQQQFQQQQQAPGAQMNL